MRADARFKSPRVRNAVVAATMLALLAIALGLAAGIAVARAPQAVVVPVNDVVAGDLRFQLPATWNAVAAPEPARSAALVWADSQRPRRRLGLVRIDAQEAIDARVVVQRYVPMFMGTDATQGVQTVGVAVHPHPQLNVLEWAGASQTASATDPRLHLAADLTADHQTHYLFYLTDEVEPDEDGRAVLLRNLALLRAVHQGARLAAPAAAP